MKVKIITLVGSLILSLASFANAVQPCSQDKFTSGRISELSTIRAYSIKMENHQGQQVGAIFLGKDKRPADMLICGTYTNYFYVNGSLQSWIPEAYEYKQIATVESATIHQDEALVSAISYTDDDMNSDDDDYNTKIKIIFQTINLGGSPTEAGEFFITIQNL